jgi:hypothetical protein
MTARTEEAKERARERNRAYHAANRESIRARHAARRAARKDQDREVRRAYVAANPHRMAAYTNGVDPNTVPMPGLFCEVCGQRRGEQELHLDHDHVTGSFRGWLCRNCNIALGVVRDSPSILRKLASYLELR